MMMGVAAAPEDDAVYEQLTKAFDVRNAMRTYEEAYPWTAITSSIARTSWRSFLHATYADKVVVCLGRKAAASAEVAHLDFFEWETTTFYKRTVQYVVIPHPSGLNRLYNTTEVSLEAGVTLREAIKRARELRGHPGD